ncbi:MAG TPA: hypothetical protein VFQ53_41715 [Kofleriaceae bacterium]|nr:hypothetical protein [Kofleriaceae bacterium]
MPWRVWLASVVLLGCAGDSPPASGRCTGALYDPCTDEHECDSALCQNFAVEGFQVCSQICNDTMPCPTGTCNANGVCQPAAPNDCTLAP